jgi:hypothetical protein
MGFQSIAPLSRELDIIASNSIAVELQSLQDRAGMQYKHPTFEDDGYDGKEAIAQL